jgi:hypothetical protein
MNSFSMTIRVGVLTAATFAFAAGLLSFVGDGGGGTVQAQSNVTGTDYVGRWHWMFQGNAFATMTIERRGDQFSGSLTGVSIEIDDNGKLTRAVATDGPSSTLQMSLDNGVMHVSEKDGDDKIEWTMTLTSPKTGELRFAGGAPANAEPIKVEKLWSEPPVQP